MFFVEKDDEETWTFVESLWWGIMTLTTVGDDIKRPSSTFGKIIGGVYAAFGVFIMSFPIPILVNSFANCYRNRVWRSEVRQKRAQKLEQQQNYLKTLKEEEQEEPGCVATIDINEKPEI